jgi:Putative bacterial sensory transduction regulator
MAEPSSLTEQAAEHLLHEHLEGLAASEPWVQHVEHDPELRRWYLRFGCDGRDAATIYLDLHQRTLRFELYFMPAPPEPSIDLYEWLLRRNHGLYGVRFSLGPDGDVYLTGRTALEHLDVDELDRMIGVIYELTETWFQPAISLAFPRV